jgi:demethylmenaquinone methyltransferase/2-methoxy-6-polyprenyl-1,4-benzoquinol methylase
LSDSAAEPVWREADLADPHGAPDKARRVQRMFNAIARSYDLNNRLHSLGRDQAWRRAAVRTAAVSAGERVLDLACGTGDLARAFTRSPADAVLGADFAPAMLAEARRKKTPRRAPLHYLAADGLRLPLPDAAVNVASIAFGIRNVADPDAAAREMRRVLRPGGRALILEFGMPKRWPLRPLYELYFHHIMPRTATWIARDGSGAYRYLPRSVNTFLDEPGLADLLRGAGFEAVSTRRLTFGIAVLVVGRVP